MGCWEGNLAGRRKSLGCGCEGASLLGLFPFLSSSMLHWVSSFPPTTALSKDVSTLEQDGHGLKYVEPFLL